jgi:hypothetical protein
MAIERTSRSFSATRIARLAQELLDASTLCAIATVSPGGRAHVNTVYFGTVALAEAWARWTHTLGQVSDDESQFSERVGQTEG